MKKLFALLVTFALAFSLAMPVFAQDTGTATPAPKAEKKKAKKAKKEKKADNAAAAPTQ